MAKSIGNSRQRVKIVDYTFKLLVIGDSGVGKTSITRRFARNSFIHGPVSSIGLDLQISQLKRKNKVVELQIWDTAGQEKYRAITIGFYRGALGFVLVYDVTNERSFLAVRNWINQIKRHAWDGTQLVLVGNKADLQGRVVSWEDGQDLAKQLEIPFVETSATLNLNIDSVFEQLVDAIIDKMEGSLEDSMKSSQGDVDLETTERALCSKCTC